MTREQLRGEAEDAIDELLAVRFFVSAERKRLLVAIRASLAKTLANDLLDDVLTEMEKRQ